MMNKNSLQNKNNRVKEVFLFVFIETMYCIWICMCVTHLAISYDVNGEMHKRNNDKIANNGINWFNLLVCLLFICCVCLHLKLLDSRTSRNLEETKAHLLFYSWATLVWVCVCVCEGLVVTYMITTSIYILIDIWDFEQVHRFIANDLVWLK